MNNLTVIEPIEGELITPDEWDALEGAKKNKHSQQSNYREALRARAAAQRPPLQPSPADVGMAGGLFGQGQASQAAVGGVVTGVLGGLFVRW